MDIEKMVRDDCACEAHQKYWSLWLHHRAQLNLFGLPDLEADFIAWAASVGHARRVHWCRAMRDVTYNVKREAASRGSEGKRAGHAT